MCNQQHMTTACNLSVVCQLIAVYVDTLLFMYSDNDVGYSYKIQANVKFNFLLAT